MSLPRRKHASRRDDPVQPPAHRRRRRRVQLYAGLEDRDIFLGNLAHTAVPSADFFLLSLLSGLIFSAALFLDAQPLFILAVLAAPFLSPLVGMSLSAVSGSGRFFFHSLGGLLVSALLVFGAGAAAGLAARLWAVSPESPLIRATAFSWADTAVLLLGAIFTAVRLYRDPLRTPRLAGAALAYELFLPLTASAFGLAAGYPQVFQAGLAAFTLRLTLAALTAVLVFDLQGLRLRLRENSSFAGSVLITAFLSIIFLTAGSFTRAQAAGPLFSPGQAGIAPVSQAETPPLPTQTAFTAATTASAPVHTHTPAPTQTATVEASPSSTVTQTRQPTAADTATPTAEPRPYLAVVRVAGAAGAYIRGEPAGAVVSSVLNGAWVEVQPQYPEQEANDTLWVYIRTDEGVEGWMMKSLLDIRASTPAP